MKTNSLLDDIHIASPCHTAWGDMTGDDRVRHCRECNLNVYNFGSMTEAEITALIRSTEGRLCARLYRRADGTLLTADCPTRQRRERHNLFLRAGLAVCSLCAVLLGCKPKPKMPPNHIAGMIQVGEMQGKVRMGDVCVPAKANSTDGVVTPPVH